MAPSNPTVQDIQQVRGAIERLTRQLGQADVLDRQLSEQLAVLGCKTLKDLTALLPKLRKELAQAEAALAAESSKFWDKNNEQLAAGS